MAQGVSEVVVTAAFVKAEKEEKVLLWHRNQMPELCKNRGTWEDAMGQLKQLSMLTFRPVEIDGNHRTNNNDPDPETMCRKRVASVATNARQSKGKLHDIFLAASFISPESKVDSGKALNVDSVVIESSGIESEKHDTSSRSGNDTHADDVDIKPVNDKEPMVEDDSNITPDSTNMSHRGGEIDQDTEQYQVKGPLLNAKLFKTKEMIEKETYNEHSHRFLLLENHCILLELKIQQKDASFQSNKPGKNQDVPEFRNFFEINDLKAQLQAKTTLICNLKNQIKSVKEAVGIRGFYNLMLLVQVCAAAED
ncbi:hypothetical protein Tco_1361441 [Tanacetum coccineum]